MRPAGWSCGWRSFISGRRREIRGWAANFFDFLRRYGASLGARRLRLEVEEENTGAIRLYARMGFKALNYRQMIREDVQ